MLNLYIHHVWHLKTQLDGKEIDFSKLISLCVEMFIENIILIYEHNYPLTPSSVNWSNARRFYYSSVGNPSGVKGWNENPKSTMPIVKSI